MRARFTLDEVQAAALEIVDRDGLSALSMRTLGTALGTGPMTLYNYVKNRDELEELVAEAVIADMQLPEPCDDWADEVRAVAGAMWDGVRRHPNAVPLVLTRRTVSASSYNAAERLVAALGTAGLTEEPLLSAFRAVLALVMGSVQVELAGPLAPDGELAAAAAQIGARAGDEFRQLAALALISQRSRPNDDFSRALDMLLAGLPSEARHITHWASGPSGGRLRYPSTPCGSSPRTPEKAGKQTHVTPRETNAAPVGHSVRISIDVPPDLVMGLLGSADENLRALERILTADLHVRGNAVSLSGEPADVALAERVITELLAIVAGGQPLTPEGVRHSVAMIVGTGNESPAEVLTLDILSRRGKTIRPKTLNQKLYVDAIDANTIVFGIGPAGTGKTYLAMAKAINALQRKQVTRIILTRPAVEAGERLGFLPGTLSEKIDPYLRPLYDALHDMMDPELIPKLMAAGVIEVAPLAYMRGRSLNDAFIILDEAQNTTPEQMKMFLTRLGFGSKMVITGDITQMDLPGGTKSGLRAAVDILDDIDDIAVAELTSADVVRHRLVGEIVDAYARAEDPSSMNRAQRRASSHGGSHGAPSNRQRR